MARVFVLDIRVGSASILRSIISLSEFTVATEPWKDHFGENKPVEEFSQVLLE